MNSSLKRRLLKLAVQVPHRELTIHQHMRFELGLSVLVDELRCEPGDEAGRWLREHVKWQVHIGRHRRADFGQLHVGADPGELKNPVPARIDA
jgi:hypothetical protein